MIDVNAVFVSWLTAQLPGVGVADEKPARLETLLPFVWIRRGGGGDSNYLDNPIMDVDCYAPDRDAVVALASRVDGLFRQRTPAGWWGVQFAFLRCNLAPRPVPDVNQALRHAASIYSFALQ